jgi:AbrB family looped-hinge helix DNA binding protein
LRRGQIDQLEFAEGNARVEPTRLNRDIRNGESPRESEGQSLARLDVLLLCRRLVLIADQVPATIRIDFPVPSQSGGDSSDRLGRSCMRPTKKPRKKRGDTAPPPKGESASGRRVTVELSRVGKRGSVIIPAALRRRYGIEEGMLVVAEPGEGGVLIRPASVVPIEVYSPERKAQFLLSNAVDAADYAGALAAVRTMGLDPDAIPHVKPPAV